MLSLSRGLAARLLWGSLLWGSSLPGQATDWNNDTLLRGMADMMALMRQMAAGGGGTNLPGATTPFPGWPSAFPAQWPNLTALPGPPTSPWGMSWGNTPTASLQGYWLGANGERLGFWQQYYLLQSVQGQTQGGRFGLKNDRLLIFEAGSSVQPYEYAQQDDRLALRDPQGRVFLYRRASPAPSGTSSWSGF